MNNFLMYRLTVWMNWFMMKITESLTLIKILFCLYIFCRVSCDRRFALMCSCVLDHAVCNRGWWIHTSICKSSSKQRIRWLLISKHSFTLGKYYSGERKQSVDG